MPMSWDRIDGVKAGRPYFLSSWFVDWVIMSSVLMRSPSMSKMQARIAGKLWWEGLLVGWRVIGLRNVDGFLGEYLLCLGVSHE